MSDWAISKMGMFQLVILCMVLAAAHAAVDDACTTPDRQAGKCTHLEDCPYLQAMKKAVTPADRKFIRYSERACPTGGRSNPNNPLICCVPAKSDSPAAWANEPQCGLRSTTKIVGGVETNPGEYPWMALMGYHTESRIDFDCGGSLINQRWVLTAAHCIQENLRTVRLGEHDLLTSPDCEPDESYEDFCYPDHVDKAVLRTVKHEGYKRRTITNDIGLVLLETPVQFTSEIRALCLPAGNVATMNLDRKKLTVAGWGRTENTDRQGSPVLKKLEVPVVTNAQCNEAYTTRTRGKISITNKQLCAGSQAAQDSCNGDSGGPLTLHTTLDGRPRWVQFGIVSFGPNKCGTDGVPGVYTRITEYLPWISTNAVIVNE